MGGIRPYGVSLLIGGVDGANSTGRLFETDPSGTMREWKAHAIGRGAKDARKVLVDEYKDGTSKEKAIEVALKALKAGEKKIAVRNVEIAIVDKKFKAYTKPEIKDFMKKFV